MVRELTHSTVIYIGVVDPALSLLHLALQGQGSLGWSHVGYGTIGLGLQVLQSSADLFGQQSGFRSVTFTPKEID